jgi:carotenoid cleavage dioxygenase-like enzyme
MDHSSALGYVSLDEEIHRDRLMVEGTIPSWLSGSLLRNGPAKFEVGPDRFKHWFDGLAMLHRFSFQDGNVSYQNKFLQSDAYRLAQKEGRITFGQFATDPCKALFKGEMTLELANANVSINKVAGDFVAMTEVPLPVAFDPQTLDTLGVIHYDDDITGHHGSAHPHYDFGQRQSISYLTEFNMPSLFKVYAIKDGQHTRTLLGSYEVPEPSYIHSFGLTEHYIVIAEYPYRVNPLDILQSGKPFIENYQWRQQEGTSFIVMDKADGRIVQRYTVESFFAYHHINAFERDGQIIVDISAYPDASTIGDLYLEKLRGNVGKRDASAENETRRYYLPLDGSKASYELLSAYGIDLPTINYRRYNTRDYGVAYGLGLDKQRPDDFSNHLIRIDTRARAGKVWSEEACYPGEPVFAEAPNPRAEDDGVVLSVVLNAEKGNSFLLILDAHTFEEIGRAEVPHHIPFGFHGEWFAR